jgi:hypothetical protein
MQSKLTCLIQIITLSCICNFACTKKNSPAPGPTPSPTKEVPVVQPPVAEKSYVPVKLEAESNMITLKYLGNTMNVSEIENSDGTKELYMYNDKEQLKEYDRYDKTDRTYVVNYIRDQDGYAIKGNQFKAESNGTVLTPIGYYKIEYTADRKISKVNWYDNSNKLLSEATRTYSDDGTNLKITTTGQNAGVVDYTFDTKKAWCSRINYNQVLAIESLPGLLLSNAGNITKSVSSTSDTQSKTYTYTYNSENYPTSWIETDVKGSKKTIKVSYQ